MSDIVDLDPHKQHGFQEAFGATPEGLPFYIILLHSRVFLWSSLGRIKIWHHGWHTKATAKAMNRGLYVLQRAEQAVILEDATRRGQLVIRFPNGDLVGFGKDGTFTL